MQFLWERLVVVSFQIFKCTPLQRPQLCQTFNETDNFSDWNSQERILKAVLFILSFQGDLKQPFLIITPSNVLSLWEAEFSHWASGENIVVYKGNSAIRATIKALEFYNEAGCVMFQVLLSPVEVVIQVSCITFILDQYMISDLFWKNESQKKERRVLKTYKS